MKYLLCHKNINVLSFEIINDEIFDIHSIYNEEHLPLFLQAKDITDKVIALREWWKGRCIPSSRQNLDNLLNELDGINLKSLTIKSLGLSLSDQYWIKPENSNLKWENVNFYENDFSPDIGNLLFGNKLNKNINFVSPDNTSDGWLLKKWIIKDNERFLLKGGSAPYEQEPFNEVLASKICECLDIPHIPYTLVKIKDKYFCSCKNITTENTELISAWNVLNTQNKNKRLSSFEHFMNCCNELKIDAEDNLKNCIGKMILLDFIIANTDRHYNNFAFLRKSDTLEWLGLAPVYDSGTSMFNTKSTQELNFFENTDSQKIEAKPFYTKQQKQLEYFSTILALQEIKFASLVGIPDFYSDLLSLNKKISEERRKLLTVQLARRIDHAQAIVYRKNDISKEFLNIINEDKTNRKVLDKISSAFTQVSSRNPVYKNILNNYLKILKPKNEVDMENLILKDVNYFFGKKNKAQTQTRER